MANTRQPNGASSIYLGNDGRWHGRVTVGIKDDGKPDRRHVSRTTRAEVTKLVRELEKQRDGGTVRKPGQAWTVKMWLTHWIENIAPIFNRCVLFETNEISYHGHPLPLKSGDTTRKSLRVYYYTAERDDIIPAADHTTVYVNTRGATGAARIAVGHFFNTFRRFSNARRRFFARRGSETDRRP